MCHLKDLSIFMVRRSLSWPAWPSIIQTVQYAFYFNNLKTDFNSTFEPFPESRSSLPPIQLYRNGYLWVSDISRQAWCEQQLEYSFTKLQMEEPEAPQLSKGTELHLARELETQDYVDVKITSNEDIFAIKVLNLLHCIEGFKSGRKLISREIPIFGTIGGIFFLGKIDELKLDFNSYTLDVVEFKTRTRKSLPGKAQKLTHDLQGMLYKYLLDEIILGNLDPNQIWNIMKLDPIKNFGIDVQRNVELIAKDIDNLETLFRSLIESAKGLPTVSRIRIQYALQEDGKNFADEVVEYKDAWLKEQLGRYLKYWSGERQHPVGVEVEEAWKCSNCIYSDDCSWREKKDKELKQRGS